jgi:hypothetical protein
MSLCQVTDGLAVPQPAERAAVGGLFDREFKQEKTLEGREREARRAKVAADDASAANTEVSTPIGGAKKDKAMEKMLKKVDRDFMGLVKAAEDRDGKVS